MNKVFIFMLFLVLSIIEIVIGSIYAFMGIHSLGLYVFMGFMCNIGFVVGLFCYLLSGGKGQTGGFMEVSNYLNLNKMANKDK